MPYQIVPSDMVPDFGPTSATGAPKFSVVPTDAAPDFGDAPSGGGPGAVSRGFVSSLLQENPGALADAAEGASYLVPDPEFASSLRDAASRLRDAAKAPQGYQPQAGGVEDLWHAPLTKGLTYLGERFGQAVGSTLPSLAGGVLGGFAGGRVAGRPGAVVGSVGGATAPSAGLNYGGMYRALVDEGVRPEVAAKWGAAAAVPITALDVAPVAGWAERLAGQGAKQEMQRSFAKRIVQEAIKGGLAEGATEGAQQVIQERVAADLTGRDFFTADRMKSILDNAIAGGLAGGAFGGVSGLPRDRAAPAAPAEEPPLQVQPLALPAPPGQRALPPPDSLYGEGFTAREPRPGEGYEMPPAGLPAPPERLMIEGRGTQMLPAPDRTYGQGFSVIPVDEAPDFGERRREFRPEPDLQVADQRTPAQRQGVEPDELRRPPAPRGFDLVPVNQVPDFGPQTPAGERQRDVSFDDVVSSIHKQESGGRETAKTSVTGARGGMQIQPATFQQYARPGESIDDPAANMAVGRRIIADLWQKSGGDPARVAVGYFSGPGNIAPPGAATPWKRDAGDPNGKTTSSYVEDVLKRLGRGGLPWDVPQEPRRKDVEFAQLPDQTTAPSLAQVEAALLGQPQEPEDVAAPIKALADEPAPRMPVGSRIKLTSNKNGKTHYGTVQGYSSRGGVDRVSYLDERDNDQIEVSVPLVGGNYAIEQAPAAPEPPAQTPSAPSARLNTTGLTPAAAPQPGSEISPAQPAPQPVVPKQELIEPAKIRSENTPAQLPGTGVAGTSATKPENQPDLSTTQLPAGTRVRVKLSDGTYAGDGATGTVTGYVPGNRPRVKLDGFSGIKAPFADLVTLEPVENAQTQPQERGAPAVEASAPTPSAPKETRRENPLVPESERGTYKGIPINKPLKELTDEEFDALGELGPTDLEKRNAEYAKLSRDRRFDEPATNEKGQRIGISGMAGVQTSKAAIKQFVREGKFSSWGEQINRVAEEMKADAASRGVALRDPIAGDLPVSMAGRVITAAKLGRFNDALRPENKVSRAAFERLTGQKLPKTLSATKALFTGKPFIEELPFSLDGKASPQGGGASLAQPAEPVQAQPTAQQPAKRTPAARVPNDTDAFRRSLAITGAAQWGGATYRVLEDDRGRWTVEQTERGVRSTVGPGAFEKWSRDDAINRAIEEAGLSETPTQEPATIEEQTPKESPTRGVQEPVPGSDAGTRAADVQPAPAQRPAPAAPPAEERGSPPDAERPAVERAETPERASEGPGRAESGRGAGEGRPDRVPAGRGEPAAADEPRAAERPAGENHIIPPGGTAEGRGLKQKARDNLAAIELVKKIEEEARPATSEEQRKLALYVGWGGLSGAFEDSNGKFGKGLEEVGAKLRSLLTDEEYRTASRSTQYAHYTAEPVVRAMWGAVQRLGFAGGRVFEPGMGIGHFLGMMPPELAGATSYSGIELDHFTARIASLLYPQSGIKQADFTRLPLPQNSFDLVIGNPPFSDAVIRSDPDYAKHGFMLHDYFFAKSLDAVRPGGVMAFVTSAGTMNKIDPAARKYLAERANFAGGIRLPSSAFKKSSNTEVTTDVLFFRKLTAAEEPDMKAEWQFTEPVELPDADGGKTTGAVNSYFVAYPEMVLGEQGFFDKLYRGRYAVHPRPGQDLAADMNAALAKLPENVMAAPETAEGRAHEDFDAPETKDGSFYVKGGVLMQYVDRKGVPAKVNAPAAERIRGLIPIRDALRDVYAADLADDRAGSDKARAALNRHYDAFIGKFGPINKATFQYRRPSAPQAEAARNQAREDARDRGEEFDESSFNPDDLPDIVIEKRPNIAPFMDDQESYRLRSIEDYNDATGESSKKAIFFENTLTKWAEPKVSSANDGVLWSMNKLGRLDLDAIADKIGKTRQQVVEDLGDNIFRDPATGVFQTKDEYLSGNVREKLRIAKEAAGADPEIRRNVIALEAVHPMPLAPAQIKAALGMSWIPTKTIEDFVARRMELGRVGVSYAPALGQWSVSIDSYGRAASSAAATSDWGTADRDAFSLLADALNKSAPRIYTGSGKDRAFDPVATQAAQDKIQAIKDAFEEWAYADETRADELAGIYNEKLNNVVTREYDGSFLTTPGVSSQWSWRPHQKRVIARIVQAGNTYMAHAVGAGKTSAMIGAGMEMRRLGLVRKPMYVVPNHMLAQFTKEFYEQYPTARIAVADERRFHTDRRKQFIANVAQDDLDAVIITHSSFGKIPISDAFADGLVREQVDEYAEALDDIEDNQDNRVTRKRLENAIEKLEQRLAGRGKGRKDQVLTFEQMGVDFLFVDEAHMFRKLDFATRQNVKGITSEGSQQAWDLFTKIRYLGSQNPNRSVVLASGTPVTNTMGELFTLSRYLQPDALKERQVSHFDSWSATFGDGKTVIEQNAAGGYDNVTRFAKFVNVPELYRMVAGVMDIVTQKQLDQYVTRPKLKGGKREFHLVPKSPSLEAYQDDLGKRMQAIKDRKGPPEPGDDIILSVINDGRHAAVDMRFVDPSAPNDPDSKLNTLIRNVHRIWKETKQQEFRDPKTGYSKPAGRGPATQMIFANLGVNPRGGGLGFSGYAWMRKEFRRLGIPPEQVAFIGDYKTHVARQKLFNDVNEGKVRILVGSVQKMGTGVNAQRRLIAVHNQDPLWYPADDEQRNGRMVRQGNMNPEVQIHDYSTKGTYDATMWGMMGRKAGFIEGFFSGDPTLREMEDLGEASAYEQAAAMSTNDERLITLADLRERLTKAERRQAAHESGQFSLRTRVRRARENIDYHRDRLTAIKEDIDRRQDTSGKNFKMTVSGQTFTKRSEAGEALLKLVADAREKNEGVKFHRIGEIGGFPVQFAYATAKGGWGDRASFEIVRSDGTKTPFSVEDSPAGAVASAEAMLRKFEDEAAYSRGQIKRSEDEIADVTPRIGGKFEGGEDISKLRKEVKDLEEELAPKERLAGAPPADPKASRFGEWRSPRDRDRIAKRIADIVRQIAPQTNVDVADDLTVRVGGRDLPGGGQYDPARNLVTVALNFGDPEITAGHEAVHALRDAGLFTGPEWATLEKAANDRWVDELGVRDLYEGVTEDVIVEEAIAQKFAEWRMQPAKVLPPIRRIFSKIRDFFQRLANALRGMGFRTAEDVFEATDRGEVGRRTPTTERGASTAASRFAFEPGAIDAAHDLSFREGRGAWVWKDKGGEFHADPAFKKRDGTLVARVFGDEVFPADDADVARASLFNTLKRQAAPVLKQPAQKPGTNAQNNAVERIFGSPHTPFRERARDAIRDATDRQFLRTKQALLDQFASVKALEKEARGETAQGSRSPYKAVRLTRNLHSVMAHVLRHGPLAVGKQSDGGVWFGPAKGWKGGGFEEIFTPIAEKGLLDLWKGWAVAVRANRLMGEGRENLMTRAEINALLPLGQQHPEFQRAFDKWTAFNTAMLDMAEASGLINADQRAMWEQSDYIPFFRVMDDVVAGAGKGKSGIANQRSGIRTLKGGTAQLNDPIENMVMNMTSLVDRSFKNLAARKVVALALEAGAMTREKYDWRKDKITPEDAARELERIGVQVRGMTKAQHAEMLNFWRMQAPTDPDVISVMVNGKPQFFRVHDPLLLQSLSSMTPRQLNGVLGIFRGAKKLLTESVTIDPAFMAANAIRDTLAAYVTTGQKGFKPGIDSLRGFVKALRESDPTKLAVMANGGGLAGFYGTAPEDARKYIERHVGRLGVESIMDTPRKLWEGWHKIGAASESANRIAIADAVKKNGGSEAEQAYQAMDLLDFGMRGASPAVQMIIEMVPFLNARVQGLYRLGRGAKENPKAFLLRGSIIAAASLALLAENWDNEDYQALEDWDKDTYWHLWVGGAHLRLPKPFEVGALFGTLPERMARSYFGADGMKESWSATKRMLLDTFAFNPTPQLVAPLIEQWANKDTFTGRPIVGADLEKLPEWMQYRPDTSETAIEVGKATGASPERIEHLVGGYFGTLGMYLLTLADKAVEVAGGYPPEPTLRIDDYPVVKRFVRADPARNTKFVTDFYDMKKEVDKTVAAVRELGKRGETDDASQFVEERLGDLAAAKVLDKAAGAMTKLRLAEQSIMRDRGMTPDQKRKAIDEITAERNALAKDYVGYAKTLRVMDGIAASQR